MTEPRLTSTDASRLDGPAPRSCARTSPVQSFSHTNATNPHSLPIHPWPDRGRGGQGWRRKRHPQGLALTVPDTDRSHNRALSRAPARLCSSPPLRRARCHHLPGLIGRDTPRYSGLAVVCVPHPWKQGVEVRSRKYLHVLLVGVVGASAALGGCGGNADPGTESPDADVPSSTTTAPRTRADIGTAIASEFVQAEPGMAFIAKDPAGLAEVAAAYCAELETSGSAAAKRILEQRLTAYLMSVLPSRPEETGGRLGRATTIASLLGWQFEKGALREVCPELSADKYLPKQ